MPPRLNDNSPSLRWKRISRGLFFTGLCFIESTSAVRRPERMRWITAWIFAGSVSRANAAADVGVNVDSRANQSIMRNGIYASAIEYLYFTDRRDTALDSLSRSV